MNPITPPRRVLFVTDYYIVEVHAGAVEYAGKAGWELLDAGCYTPPGPGAELETGAGVLAIARQPALRDRLSRCMVPVVQIGQHAPQWPSIVRDSRAVGMRAAEYLLTLGRPHFGYYCRGREEAENEACWGGFLETLHQCSRGATLLDCAPVDPEPGADTARRGAWLSGQLAGLPRPLAVLAQDDTFLADLFAAAALLGWRIPEDMAVMGLDDRALVLGKLPLPVTSMDTGLHRMGYEAAALLDRLMSGEPAPAGMSTIPPGKVSERLSTGIFHGGHPGVRAAVQHVRGNYTRPLALHELAAAAGVSERAFQMLFKECTGRTLTEELLRLRLEKAVLHLGQTDWKVSAIAHECGLGSASYFCRVFRSAFGCSPDTWRRQQSAAARL